MRQLAVLAACAAVSLTIAGASSPARAQPAEIVVGATVPLTSSYALSGRSSYDAFRMAEEDINEAGGINGKKLKILFEDTANSNTTAVSAFKKLVDGSKPVAMFLSSYTVQNLAVEPEVARAQIPTVYLGGGESVAERHNPWMFRVRPSDGLAAKAAAGFAATGLKVKKVGLIGIEGDYGEGGMRAAAGALEKAGVAISSQQTYHTTDKDMSAQLLALKNSGAEAIIAFPYSPEASIVLRQRRQLNLAVPLIGGAPICRTGAMSLMAVQDLQNVYCFTDNFLDGNDDPRVAAWVKSYTERFKVPPDAYSAAAYDGVFVMKQAIEKAGTDPKAIRDALATLSGYKGVGNTYTFDKDGEGVHEVVILKAKPGTKDFTLVEKVSGS